MQVTPRVTKSRLKTQSDARILDCTSASPPAVKVLGRLSVMKDAKVPICGRSLVPWLYGQSFMSLVHGIHPGLAEIVLL